MNKVMLPIYQHQKRAQLPILQIHDRDQRADPKKKERLGADPLPRLQAPLVGLRMELQMPDPMAPMQCALESWLRHDTEESKGQC